MQIGSLPQNLNASSPKTAKLDYNAGDDRQGALIIIDNFQSSQSHGFEVEGAAASLGSTGPVYRYSNLMEFAGRPTLPHVLALSKLQAGASKGSLGEGQASQCMRQFVEDAVGGNIQLASEVLKQVTAEGFHQSVVNYSQGLDSIVLLHLVKQPLSENSKLDPSRKEIYRDNLTKAVAPQASVALNEQQLDNLLLQNIKQTLKNSPVVADAKATWQHQVQEFEAGHNSVVLAAGNSGIPSKALKQAGFEIDGSEDLNVFAVPEVTVVGATGTNAAGDITLHNSSSFGPEVSFLAPGDFGENFGTSFASPKVANALRAAHLANPEFTSQQVQDWATTEISHQAEIGGQKLALLDIGRTHSLLRIAG